jgi:hypothetical protein
MLEACRLYIAFHCQHARSLLFGTTQWWLEEQSNTFCPVAGLCLLTFDWLLSLRSKAGWKSLVFSVARCRHDTVQQIGEIQMTRVLMLARL